MDPLGWAKDRACCVPQQQTYVTNPSRKYPQGESRRTSDFDDNELGKLFATLQRRGRQEVTKVTQGLTSTQPSGLPRSGFARRSNNKWLGLFKILQAHVVSQLPPAGNDGKDDVRAIKWLRRLREIKDKNPALLDWLTQEEQSRTSVESALRPQQEAQPSPPSRPARSEQGKRRNNQKGRR